MTRRHFVTRSNVRYPAVILDVFEADSGELALKVAEKISLILSCSIIEWGA